jgi:hypothetical protein
MYSPNRNKNIACHQNIVSSTLKFNNDPEELLSEAATANQFNQ